MSVIAIDFDGTCVTHNYPSMGRDIGAAPVIKKLVKSGYKIILWTMRSGPQLEEAVSWFKKNNIPLYGINNNPTQKKWTDSPKAYANFYIDDAALGAPLIYSDLERPYINWDMVEKMLKPYIAE